MTTYTVTAELKNPGCYHSGWQTEVNAANKSEALKYAKADAKRECIFDRHDGPVKWQAEAQ